MELQEAIQKRKTSNNAFLNKPVLESDLRQIINAANRAPSHFNSQPWDFIVITDENKRREIGQIAKDSMKKLMEQGTFFERYKKYFRFSKQDIETKRTGIHIDRIPFFLRPFISFLFSQKAVSVLNF
ncbi:MAG: nitroreductase family protein, partial [Leptospiraceae bacterium]|nr:nitroreductase family protein [Leptospiraceae bacterium]